MDRSVYAIGSGAAALLALSAGAAADVVYQEDFEVAGHRTEWSINNYDSNAHFSRFIGRLANHNLRLTLDMPELDPGSPAIPGTPGDPGGDDPLGTHFPDDPNDGTGGGTPGTPAVPAERLLLEFDLYLIDSWDGDDFVHGEDRFSVRVNGIELLSETFANQHPHRSAGDPDVGPVHMGYNSQYPDSIYRFAFLLPEFDPETDRLVFEFEGEGLYYHATHWDESWGLDNISLTRVQGVPAPGASVLGACAGLLLTRRRRR